MMGSLIVERSLKAPLEKVWAAAGDFTKSPDPSLPIAIVKMGDESKNGIGCERKITIDRKIIHERLERIDPPNSLSYTMLSGQPVTYYLEKVELFREGEGTKIKWSAEFTPKYLGTGWIVKLVTWKTFHRFIDELERIT